MTFIALVPQIYYNIKQYGAVVDGTTNDLSKINDAMTACSNAGGGIVYFPGIAAISGPVVPPANVWLKGGGEGTGLKATSGFSGTAMVNITSDYAGVSDMQFIGGPSTTIASNPATDAIGSNKRWARLENLYFTYMNGWCINIQSSGATNPAGNMIDNVWGNHNLNGIHLKSTDANFTGQLFLSNIHLERVEGGDGIFLEDISDVFMANVMAACTQTTGTGNPLHIKGKCQTIKGSSIEFGMFPGNPSSSCVLVESGTNGSPSDITLSSGEILDGQIGLELKAGKQFTFVGLKIGSNNTHGVLTSGSVAAVTFDDCIFVANGQVTGGNRYSFDNTSSGDIYLNNCIFQDNIGAGAGQTDNIIASSAGTLVVTTPSFTGTGLTVLNRYKITGGSISSGLVSPQTLCCGDLTIGTLGTITGGTVYFAGVETQEFLTLTSVRARFGTGGAGHYDIGVYTDNAGVPDVRIDHAAATNTTLTDAVSASVNPAFINGNMLLPPGRYWLAFWTDSSTDQVLRQNAATGFAGPIKTLASAGPLPASGAGAANATTKVILAGLISGNWS